MQTAVARAISQVGGAVAPEVLGGKLYELLVTDGRLRETYAAFVGDVMGTAIPQPGFWADVGIVEHEDETEVITRSSAIIGDPSERTERLTNQKDRVADQQFEVTLAPLTARFFYIRPAGLTTPREVAIKVTEGGQPSDHAWHVTLKTSLVIRSEPKRLGPKGIALKGLGAECPGIWVGVFNADPAYAATYEVAMAVRPSGLSVRTSSPFKPPASWPR